MKKNKKILSIFSLGLMASTLLSLSVLSNNNNKSISIGQNSVDYSNFYTKKDNNNSVIDYGNENFQYRNLVSSNLVNNPQFYNKQNVLSTQSNNVAFNKDFYFNFFSSGPNQSIYIMITAKNPSVATDISRNNGFGYAPEKIETQFKQMGNDIRLGTMVQNNELVIVGNTSTSAETEHKYGISVFKINAIKDVLNPNSADYNHAISLNKAVILKDDVSHKLATNDDKFKAVTKQTNVVNPVDFISYNVPTFPIYLSPIQNVDNISQLSNKLDFVVWVGGYSLGNWDTSMKLAPVHISFDRDTGNLSYNNTDDMVFPISSTQTPDPAIRTPILNGVTKDNISVGAPVAVTPILCNNGEFKIYVHQLMPFLPNISVYNNKNSLLVEEFSADKTNKQWYISKFINQPILASSSAGGLNFASTGASTIQSIQSDPTVNMPYALARKGDKDHPDGIGSDELNLLYIFSTSLLTTSPSSGDWNPYTPTIAMNVNVDLANNAIYGDNEKDLYFYDGQNKLNTNFLFINQYSYPEYDHDSNLETGVIIPLNYRGFTENTYQTRIGILNWRTPWDTNVWSDKALRAGGSVFQGYTAFLNGVPRATTPVKDSYSRYITPTVFDEKLSVVGLYKGENAATKPNVFSSSKNLLEANFSSNDLKTSTPAYISISRNDGTVLDPNLIGKNGVVDIIKDYTKDRAHDFFVSGLQTHYSVSKNNEFLSVKGSIMNPYGNSSTLEDKLPFNLNISFSPEKSDIDSPLLFSNKRLFNYPSSINDEINFAFRNSSQGDVIFNKFPGVIGDDDSNIIQVKDSMIPFIRSMSATPNDFLGKLNINYTISADYGITNFNYSVTVNGFWANLYIILIVLAAVILIAISITVTLLIQKKRHKENISKGLMRGIHFFNNKNNKAVPSNLPNQQKTMNNQDNNIEKKNEKK
ncbi:MAG: hypothetical protein ACRDCG_01970 [Mycoplasmoidaceae bacterium]